MYRFESLEARLLLAADLADDAHDLLGPAAAAQTELHAAQAAGSSSALAEAEGEDAAEGEAAPDLVAFAKAIADSGTIFFGAAWCPHCTEQKELFEDGGSFLPFVEVTNLDNPVTLNAVGTAEGISSFPTWEFPDGTRLEGTQTLETLSQRSGVAIPSSDTPSIAPIDDGDLNSNDTDADGDEIVTLLGGSPMHIPLDGYDPGGGPLTYQVSSSNPSLVTPTLLQGNRSMLIDVAGWGKMNFQLFEQRAMRPTERLIELAESNFYDGIEFHRIVNEFVIQAGDPTATGSGGSTLGDFDDQFHEELQHNRSGVLSYAKSSDDTNDSQFFITEGGGSNLRGLDGNHSVAGILVEGDANREAISNVSTTNPRDVIINSVDIFTDTENAVVMLAAAEGATGSAEITVTATDEDGNTFTRIFTVNVQPDTFDTRPWLDDIPDFSVLEGSSLSTQIMAHDVEGDAIQVGVVAPTNFTVMVPTDPIVPMSPATANISITPDAGFVGQEQVTFFVYDSSDPTFDNFDPTTATLSLLQSNSQLFDVQTVMVESLESELSVDLLAQSDSGSSVTDNITNVSDMVFEIDGVTAGATVTVRAGDTVIGSATASGSTVQVTTDITLAGGDGTYMITAVQQLDGQTSGPSPALAVTLDTTGPVFQSTPPSIAFVDDPFTYNAETDDEQGAGASYVRVDPVTGDPVAPVQGEPVVNPATGVFAWTPATGDIGENDFALRAADIAGNTTTQTFTLDVAEAPTILFRLEVTKNGNPISESNPLRRGDEFTLSVFVEDKRPLTNSASGGVFSAYLDILFDSTLANITGALVNGPLYQPGVANAADVSQAGVIDHAGSFAASLSPPGQDEALLFTVPLLAVRAGTLTFMGEPATEADDPGDQGDSPAFDSGVYGDDDAICPSVSANCFGSLSFLDAEVEIGSSFTIVDFEFQPDEDSQNNPIEVDLVTESTAGSSVTLMYTGTPTANNGSVVISNDGTELLYTPDPDFFGTDVIMFSVTDGTDVLDGMQSFDVFNTNDAPNAVDDSFTVDEDVTTPTFLDVLANDESAPDPASEKDQFRIDTFQATTAQGGTVTLTAAGQALSYTAPANFTGTDTFTYTVSDRDPNNPLTDTATVTITVTDVNDPPNAVNDTFGGAANPILEDSTNVELDVLANDTSAPDEGETLTITAVTQPANGSVSISQDGTRIFYTPDANFFGEDTFTYTITDNDADDPRTDTATVVVNVTDTTDAPTANDDGGSDNPLLVRIGTSSIALDVLANDSSAPDGPETLTIISVTNVSDGSSVQVSSDGLSILYTPTAGLDVGDTTTFTYTIEDEDGDTASAMATVTIVDFDPGSISGFVYVDANDNGIRDEGERGLAGVTVTLTGTDDLGATVNRTVETSADGSYTFGNLAPGEYVVAETQPPTDFEGDDAPLIDGKDTIGSLGGDVENDRFTITLTSGTDSVNNNFGELKGGTLNVAVRQSVSDPAPDMTYQGLTVQLFQSGQPVRDPATTGRDGSATFSGLPPGEYEIRVGGSFLTETVETVTFATSADASNIEVRDPRVAPIHQTYLDSLSSRSPQYSQTAIGSDGMHWQGLGPGWEEASNVTIGLTSDATGLIMNILNSTGRYEGTVPLSHRQVRVLSSLDDGTLRIRLNGSMSDFEALLTQTSATVNIATTADGDEDGPDNGTFTVTQSDTRSSDTVVSYTVSGTATAGSDFTPLSGSVTIPAGETSAEIDVDVLGDNLLEGTETVIVTLDEVTSGSSTISIDASSDAATVDIADFETASITGIVNGTEASTISSSFTVTLSATSTTDTVIAFTVGGTATSGSDYTDFGSSVTIPAGQTSATVTITTLADDLVEGPETITVQLESITSGNTGYELPTTVSTITLNDAETVSIAGTSDGDEDGPVDGAFAVTMSGTSTAATVVEFMVAGTAAPGTDFTALSGTVTIPAGQTSVTIPVPVLQDSVVESDETVIVTLDSVTNSSLDATDNTSLTISTTADSASIEIEDRTSVDIAAANDGTEAGPTNGRFIVTISRPVSGAATTVAYTVGGTATAGADYTALSGTVTIPAGASTANIDVPVLDDDDVEGTETVTVTLDSATSGSNTFFIDPNNNSDTVDIADGESVSIEATVDGGEDGPVNGAFTVSLSAPTATATVISYSVSGSATSSVDFAALSGSVTIPAGSTSATIDVPVLDDNVVEGSESVVITLDAITSGNSALTIDTANDTAAVNIVDAESVSIAATTDGNEDGPVDGEFTVSLSGPSATSTVVSYSVSGTATAGSDFTALSGSVTIPAGMTSAVITVAVVDDDVEEGDETVIVTLDAVTSGNAAIGVDSVSDSATIDLLDDETGGEGESGSVNVVDQAWADYDSSGLEGDWLPSVGAAEVSAVDAAFADEAM